MAPPKRIAEYDFREFKVLVARVDDAKFACQAYLDGARVADATAATREDAERNLREQLLKISADYIGLDGARKVFLKHFPNGFSDSRYLTQERNYKLQASEFVGARLSEMQLRNGNRADTSRLIRDAAQKTNLLSQFELIKLNEATKSAGGQTALVEAVLTLLYGDDFDRGLDSASASLRRLELSKWPIVTYFPFMRFPSDHMFLKPEVTKDCADRLGFDLGYETSPNSQTYARLLELTNQLRGEFQDLHPRDNIDIQSVIWVLGDKDYRKSLADNP